MKNFLKIFVVLSYLQICTLNSCEKKDNDEIKRINDFAVKNLTDSVRDKLDFYDFLDDYQESSVEQQIYHFHHVRDIYLDKYKVSAICTAANNSLIISYIADFFKCAIDIVNCETGECEQFIPTNHDLLRPLILLDKKTLLGGTVYGKTIMRDIENNNVVGTSVSLDYSASPELPHTNKNLIIDFFTSSATGNIFCFHKHSLNIYDWTSNQWKEYWSFKGRYIKNMCMLPSGNLVLYKGKTLCRQDPNHKDDIKILPASLQVFNVYKNVILRTIECNKYNITSMHALSESIIAAGTISGKILIIDLRSSTILQIIKASKNPIFLIKSFPNGNFISYSNISKTVKIWSNKKSKPGNKKIVPHNPKSPTSSEKDLCHCVIL